jgi:hypothetical protein
MTPIEVITEIAKTQLGIETLETRNRDSLDFHDCSVFGIKKALMLAYKAGQLNGIITVKPFDNKELV